MNASGKPRRMGRRHFLRRTSAAGVAGLATISRPLELAGSIEQGTNYDIERFREVDPSRVGWKRADGFDVARAEPRRIAAGRDGRIWIAAGRKLVVFDSKGAALAEVALSNTILGIGLAGDGVVYAGVKDHIEVLDSGGKRQAAWDAPSGRPLLTGIAVGERDVFVADAGNRIVWRYDRSGKLMGRIGTKDPGRNIPGFVVPSGFFDLELGPDDLLRVANPGRHRVETYTIEGDLEISWGRAGAAIEAFCGCCNPVAIELLPGGRVATFEKGLPRVKIYSAHGALETVVAPPSAFADPRKRTCEWSDCNYGGLDGAVDGLGRILVLDLIAGDVQRMVAKDPGGAGGYE